MSKTDTCVIIISFVLFFPIYLCRQLSVLVKKKKKHNLYNHPNIKAGDTSAGDFSPSAE